VPPRPAMDVSPTPGQTAGARNRQGIQRRTGREQRIRRPRSQRTSASRPGLPPASTTPPPFRARLPAIHYERSPGAAGRPLPQGYRRREPEKTVLCGPQQGLGSTPVPPSGQNRYRLPWHQLLRRMLRSYFHYYHGWRVHQALEMDCPESREVHSVDRGPVVEIPEIGGLHHHYERVAA